MPLWKRMWLLVSSIWAFVALPNAATIWFVGDAFDRVEPGLPSHWYHDPDHHRRELEVFWHGMSACVARDEELPSPRDYRVVELGGQSLLLVRDADGRIRGFRNACRHRGSIPCGQG